MIAIDNIGAAAYFICAFQNNLSPPLQILHIDRDRAQFFYRQSNNK